MANQTSIKGLMQQMSKTSSAVLVGAVTSADPLKIKLANDSKIVLRDSIIFLPIHLTNHTVTVSIDGGSEVSMVIKNALQEGESVYVLSLNNGKKYFILDRM